MIVIFSLHLVSSGKNCDTLCLLKIQSDPIQSSCYRTHGLMFELVMSCTFVHDYLFIYLRVVDNEIILLIQDFLYSFFSFLR